MSEQLKLYKIWQEEYKNEKSYGMYEGAIVCASSEEEARKMHPSESEEDTWFEKSYIDWSIERTIKAFGWIHPEKVKVEYIGIAKRGTKAGVILSSYYGD